MPDLVDAATRSRMMRGIRAKDTKPEMRVRRRLHAAGLRYRLHDKVLPGKPDLVFRRAKTVVFVNGCFWHQHQGCRFAYQPSTNVEFWRNKLRANVARDGNISRELSGAGWHVEVLWECENNFDIDALAGRIRARIRDSSIRDAMIAAN